MEKPANFYNQIQNLLTNGFTKLNLPPISNFKEIERDLLVLAADISKTQVSSLDKIHEFIPVEQINEYRVKAIHYLNTKTTARADLIQNSISFFKEILGQDIAAQKNLNVVMLPPNDPTSILPLHADTWTGHSNFELVLLYPLYRCVAEQNMFVLPQTEFQKNSDLFSKNLNLQELTTRLEPSLHFLELNPFEAVVLWHATPHGNRINKSNSTHWSLNLRFKNLFTPYEQKNLGEYFQPICMSAFNEFVFSASTGRPTKL